VRSFKAESKVLRQDERAGRIQKKGIAMSEESLETQYPSIELAYPIAVASYDSMARRLDTVDARLQTIMAFSATISAAVPSIAGARGAHFNSGAFDVAMALFILSMIIGAYARLAGNLRVLSPDHIYREWLSSSPIEFKKDGIYFAAQDFIANRNLVYRKWLCSVIVTILFALEAAALVVWVWTAPS
jgi:hypothetical protein